MMKYFQVIFILAAVLMCVLLFFRRDRSSAGESESANQFGRPPYDGKARGPCDLSKSGFVYVMYGVQSIQQSIKSAQTLRRSLDHGGSILASRPPIIIMADQRFADGIRSRWGDRLATVIDQLIVVPNLPDISKKESIPHSNKIRALSRVFELTTIRDCMIYLDWDTAVARDAPWHQVFDTLEIYDVSAMMYTGFAMKDTSQFVPSVFTMINTGLMGLRNSPLTRKVLKEWLSLYKPCPEKGFKGCMAGTDQHPFTELVYKHRVPVFRLWGSWNCRMNMREKRELGKSWAVEPVFMSAPNFDSPEAKPEHHAWATPCHIIHGYEADHQL